MIVRAASLPIAALSVVFAVSSRSLAQTFFFAGPINSNATTTTSGANPSNVFISNAATVSTAYVMPQNWSLTSATLTSVITSTLSEQATIRLRNSAFPGVIYDLNPFGGSSTFTVLNASPATRYDFNSQMIGLTIPAGSVWSVEFYEKVDNGASADARWTNLGFSFGPSTSSPSSRILTFTAPGPIVSVDAMNDPDNTILNFTNPATAPVRLYDGFSMRAGTRVNITAAGSTIDHMRVRITNSAHPGVFSVAQLSTWLAPLPGPVNLTFAEEEQNNYFWSTGLGSVPDLEDAIIPVGSNFSFQFFETVQNGPANVPEATITNASFHLTAAEITLPLEQSFSLVGPYQLAGLPRDPGNSVINLGSATSSYIFRNTINLGVTGTRLITTSSTLSLGLRIRNSAFPFHNVDFHIWGAVNTSSNAFALVTQLVSVFPNNSVLDVSSAVLGEVRGNLGGLLIPAGSVWSAEPFTLVDAGAGSDYVLNTLSIGFYSGSAFVPNTFTSAIGEPVVDLGILSTATAPQTFPLSRSVTLGPSLTRRWFKFQTLTDMLRTDPYFIDALMTNTGNFVDTCMYLYDDKGYLIATDSESGPDDSAQLSIGTRNSPRSASSIGTTSMEPGLPFNGISKESLEAGTYYLVVTAPDESPSFSPFGMSNSFAEITTPMTFWLRTNLPGPTRVNGTVVMGNIFSGTIHLAPLQVETYNLAGTRINSPVTTTISSNGSFSVLLGVPNGTYTLRFRSQGSLREAFAGVVLNGGTVTLGSQVRLRNGNADGDTEVGPGDFSAVLNAFGDEGAPAFRPEDLDRNGEVGPSDFTIVLNRFGTEDE